MKKGKTSRINNFESLKVNFGTVDSKNLKSIYINIQSWVNPKISSDNWNRVVCNLSREIKHSVYNNLDRNLYEETYRNTVFFCFRMGLNRCLK